MSLSIGTRVRFTQTLDSPANEERPAQLYARKGELGRIIGHDCREGYQVVTDSWPHWFGAERNEFEVIEITQGATHD
jgi:hypothetical protein